MTATESVYTETQREAERLMRAGLSVIPVPAGEKNPNRKGWQNERWKLEDIGRQWNNGQGIGILWGEPSGGLVDIDLDWREARIAAQYILPATRTFGRPGAPESHRIYRVKDEIPKSKKYKLPGDGPNRCVVEFLSTGAQSLVPPSLHESGERRVWHRNRPTEEVDGKALKEGAADVATAALIAHHWPGQGARHDYALAATGYIGRRLPRARAERTMEAAIAASGDEEAHGRMRDVRSTLNNLDAGRPATGGPALDSLAPGVVEQLRRWHHWGEGKTFRGPRSGGSADGDTPTHDELRDRFIAAHPNVAYGVGVWRRYGGGIWEETDELGVVDGVCQVAEEAKAEGIRPTRSLVGSVAELTRVRVAVPDRMWDANPDVLVCANGTLNLETRELMPHAKEHYATAAVPYAYDPGAGSVSWELVMREVVAENLGPEAVEFMQEFAGYALTTATEHEIALWLHGRHGGGRSTIIAGLEAMLGERAGVLSLSDIDRSNFALSNLAGKTLMTATEQPSIFMRGGGKLNAIISGEPILVDRKYRDPITVVPRCKIAWAMNELPRIANNDDGLFRRVKILEIPEIPPEHRDPQVKEDVKRSGAAILNWSLDGLERLRKRGRFVVPDSVKSATQDFKEHNDVPAMFVAEACDTGEGFSESSSRLYEVYSWWCKSNGHKPLASNNAAREWRRLGFVKERKEAGVRWYGVRIELDTWGRYERDVGRAF